MHTATRPDRWTSTQLDLRRAKRERIVDAVLERAQGLPREDRLLLEAVYRDGRSLVSIALEREGAANPSGLELRARTLGRRVRKLVARLTDPTFQYASEYLATGAPGWTPLVRGVAERSIIHGQGIRRIASDLGSTVYAVRKARESIIIEARTAASLSKTLARRSSGASS